MVEQPERYCSNCGHELKPEDQFCSNCGMPVHRTARVPTPNADRAVPPLPPPTQELGRRRRSLPGSGALRGRGRKLVVILVLVVLLLYLVLPLVMESLIAWRLQTAFGTPTKPDVEVSSNFPPMMFLGRIDRVQVRMDQASLQGVLLYNARADLKGVSVSVPSLIAGSLAIETESCSLSVDAPPIFIDENQACLNYLGFGAGY
jgi:zinc-ribbon domain/LmeA-like phospholipid-binding